MQKFLEKREVASFALVAEQQPNPDSFAQKKRVECGMPEYRDTGVFPWHFPRHVCGTNDMSRFGLDIRLPEESVCVVGKGKVSKLPDGTKHGPFHVTSEEDGYARIYTGSYRMGLKHGNFWMTFQVIGSKVVVQEKWECGKLLFFKRKAGDVSETLRYTGKNSGVWKIFIGGNLSEKKEFKNFLFHGACERYRLKGVWNKIRTREIYDEGVMIKRTRFYPYFAGVKQVSHYKSGSLHGLRETFSFDGDTTTREIFENGELVVERFY
ncbi:hypothetical protein [Brazilian marseillevirus]|uniref:hypothetical protein n=1 Tax=Brazilian marseillevirus TaxID=1813599 RepID=UPI0007837EB1|nr:hypothetical protein A3303_gp109 [Brazilian marseillevirus]AMQ10617.1 hypothetical protein [Brazilian marseillevirus]